MSKRFTVGREDNNGRPIYGIWDNMKGEWASNGYPREELAQEFADKANASDPISLQLTIHEQAKRIAELEREVSQKPRLTLGSVSTDMLKARIAELEAENAALEEQLRRTQKAVDFFAWELATQAPTTEAPQAPAPVADVTLTSEADEFPPHDADDFSQADLEFFAHQTNPEKFWYYEELSPRQKAAIAARRQTLGLE